MKLLLTSGGITNSAISAALFALVGKEPGVTSLVVIPTASNVQQGDKGWLIDDLVNLKKQNLRSIDIVDISAIDRRLWLARMTDVDVLYFGGGNRYHLMEWITRSGLAEVLPGLLRDKVYVGMSAGSMVTGTRLGLRLSHTLYNDDLERTEDLDGLGYVNFSFLPHLNNSHFVNLTHESIERVIDVAAESIYAVDDSTALRIVDNRVSVVGEGAWRAYGQAHSHTLGNA
jgi:dipeptidase E